MEDVIFTHEIDVQLIRAIANDDAVVTAARVSTLGSEVVDSSFTSNSTEGLINFLMKNRHGTPFEHNQFTFFIDAPIFAFREFHRHRIGWSYNEESGRYKELRGKFYIPDRSRNLIQIGRPGHYHFEPGGDLQFEVVADSQMNACHVAYDAYRKQLEAGIAKEVARMCLPVSTYSSMYATCNARSLMAFLSLRQTHTAEEAMFPSTPMFEINLIANTMEMIFQQTMPITHAAFVENGYVAP